MSDIEERRDRDLPLWAETVRQQVQSEYTSPLNRIYPRLHTQHQWREAVRLNTAARARDRRRKFRLEMRERRLSRVSMSSYPPTPYGGRVNDTSSDGRVSNDRPVGTVAPIRIQSDSVEAVSSAVLSQQK